MKKYPIAERFTSLQGEGLYTGTMMYFIRFAGCSVGKKMTEIERNRFSGLEQVVLPLYREKCTLYDGREFACDTDFRTKEVLTSAELLATIPVGVKHVCLTGGEPMNHDLTELLKPMEEAELQVHIETSGTVSMTEKAFPDYLWQDSLDTERGWLWVTVSPKFGLLDEMIGLANEIKLLVDDDFDIKKVPADILDHRLVWIQPVNKEWEVDKENMRRCIKLLHEYPNWRMSSQMHKIWGVR